MAWRSFAPGDNRALAAVAFHFAEDLQREKGGAIGIIQSSVGGTPAEAWTPRAALESQPELKSHADLITQALARRSADEWRREVEDYENFRAEMKQWSRTKSVVKLFCMDTAQGI